MDIKVLEVGCSKCKVLLQRTIDAAKQLGLEESIEAISDMEQIMKYRILNLPALVINGDVKSAGKVPKTEQIVRWMEENK